MWLMADIIKEGKLVMQNYRVLQTFYDLGRVMMKQDAVTNCKDTVANLPVTAACIVWVDQNLTEIVYCGLQ